jgi:Cu2+-exporting ATPase
MTSSLTTATLDVTGMKCAGCVAAVERQLKKQPGVISACVNLITAVAVVEYAPDNLKPQQLAEKLTSSGFPAEVRDETQPFSPLTAGKQEAETQQQTKDLIIALILLIFSFLGHLQHLGLPALPIVSHIGFHWTLATAALLFPGRSIIRDGWRSISHGNPNMNTLVGLGTLSAYLTSCVALAFPQLGWECFFDEPVMLLGFILLGRNLETRARINAAAALEALIALQPQLATLIPPDSSLEVSGIPIPVSQIRQGEWVKVLPGEKIPVDGAVMGGETTLDESLVTGESLPVAKQVGDNVIAGTINQSGTITVKTTRIGQQTTLAKIITSVEEAQTRKAPVQKFADTIAGYFAYGVMAIASLTFLFWQVMGTKFTFSDTIAANLPPSPLLLSLKLAIAVLVIACPCALGLATPTAILVGTSIGAKRGILIKGGDILEKMNRLTTIVFDKTGTLTQGKPQVTDCLPHSDLTPSQLLQLAATVESGTNHPLGTAILQAAQQQNLTLLPAAEFYTQPGLGVSARVGEKRVLLGNQTWMTEDQRVIPETLKLQGEKLAKEGKTVVYIAIDAEMGGLIALKDNLRPEAVTTVKTLQNLGLEVRLLSGDRPEVAQAIATQVGITAVDGGILAEQKGKIIQSLRENSKNQQKYSKIIAMVGDGINDAPALAAADIGIALKTATDIAIETAGIVLMSDRLSDVVESWQLSRATTQKIQQNLLWALGYNMIMVPLAAGFLLPQFGLILSPAVAGAFMAFSSVTVVTNSLLLRYQFKPTELGIK